MGSVFLGFIFVMKRKIIVQLLYYSEPWEQTHTLASRSGAVIARGPLAVTRSGSSRPRSLETVTGCSELLRHVRQTTTHITSFYFLIKTLDIVVSIELSSVLRSTVVRWTLVPTFSHTLWTRHTVMGF